MTEEEPLHLQLPRRSLSGSARRVPPCFTQVQLLPGEDLEELVTQALSTLETTWVSLQVEQQDLLLEMGYTKQGRMTLSCLLAQNLYRQGWPDFPREKLHRVMKEGELQALLYRLICGGALPDLFPPPTRKEETRESHMPEVPQPKRYRCGGTSQWRSRRRGSPDTP